LDLIFLVLAYRLRWAEIPLLAHNFAERCPAIRRPSQNELLCTGSFALFKNKGNAPQPNGLAARHCRTPAPRFSGNEGRLYRRIIVFRCDLYHGCALDIQPALPPSPYGLRSWSDKPLTHMTLVYLGTTLVSTG